MFLKVLVIAKNRKRIRLDKGGLKIYDIKRHLLRSQHAAHSHQRGIEI